MKGSNNIELENWKRRSDFKDVLQLRRLQRFQDTQDNSLRVTFLQRGLNVIRFPRTEKLEALYSTLIFYLCAHGERRRKSFSDTKLLSIHRIYHFLMFTRAVVVRTVETNTLSTKLHFPCRLLKVSSGVGEKTYVGLSSKSFQSLRLPRKHTNIKRHTEQHES